MASAAHRCAAEYRLRITDLEEKQTLFLHFYHISHYLLGILLFK
jgi:hypothetical protein